jgi:hypothetical protein
MATTNTIHAAPTALPVGQATALAVMVTAHRAGAVSWSATAIAARPPATAMTTTIVGHPSAIAAMTIKATKIRP